MPLERLFEVTAVKYARVRTFAASAVRALTYFADAETTPMPQMIQRASWSSRPWRPVASASKTSGQSRNL